MSNAISEHGEPELSILAVGDKDYLYDLEIKMIEEYQTNKPQFGYNVNIGNKHSAISRAAISKATQGRTPWNKGKPRTPEERAAIKAALAKSEKFAGKQKKLIARNKAGKGRKASPEECARIGAMHKGKPKSAEQRAKMAEARRLWWERRRSIPHI